MMSDLILSFDKLFEITSSVLAGGEELTIDTPKMQFAVSKNEARDIADRRIEIGGATINLPPWCDIYTTGPCDGDDIISMEVGAGLSCAMSKKFTAVSLVLHVPGMMADVVCYADTSTTQHPVPLFPYV